MASTGLERLFSVFASILGLCCSLAAVSHASAGLTQLHLVSGSQVRSLATLRQYLRQNNVSAHLALRMQRNAQHALSAELTADVVELLPVVSEPLRVELAVEIYGHTLSQHPFMGRILQQFPSLGRRICHQGMSTLTFFEGDIIFSQGDVAAQQMFFVQRGTLEYYDRHGETSTIFQGQWIAEPALWVSDWAHRGSLRTITEAKLCVLDVKVFHELVQRKELAASQLKMYASEFVARMNEQLATASDMSPPPVMAQVLQSASRFDKARTDHFDSLV